jgi:hypothetical protein
MTKDQVEFIRDILWPLIRDILLFFGGLGLAVNEVLHSGVERPVVLGFLAAMMGLPIALRADRPKRGEGDDNK